MLSPFWVTRKIQNFQSVLDCKQYYLMQANRRVKVALKLLINQLFSVLFYNLLQILLNNLNFMYKNTSNVDMFNSWAMVQTGGQTYYIEGLKIIIQILP